MPTKFNSKIVSKLVIRCLLILVSLNQLITGRLKKRRKKPLEVSSKVQTSKNNIELLMIKMKKMKMKVETSIHLSRTANIE